MNWSPLQKLLPKAAAHHGFSEGMKAAQICQEYRKLALTLLPSGALEHTAPKHYRRQILTVRVFNAAWGQQVLMQRHHILKAINQKFGEKTLKDIRIEIAEKPDELSGVI